MSPEEQAAVEAVKISVRNQCAALTPWNLIGFSDSERERMKTDDQGHCILEIVAQLEGKAEDEEGYLVMAPLYFAVIEGDEIEGSNDVYLATRNEQGGWDIQWDRD